MDSEGLIDPQRLRELASGMLHQWHSQENLEVKRVRLSQPHQIYAIHSMAAHVHHLAPAVLRLDEEIDHIVATPLVRLAYESALTAQWLMLRPDAANAFMNEDVRKRRATVANLSRSASHVLNQGSVAGHDLDALETSASGVARNFDQLCAELHHGYLDAYVYYRLLSWHAHPSVALVDDYLEPRGDDEWPVMLRVPNFGPSPYVLYFLVCSMVWAGRAVDVFDADRRRRRELRSVARELGIPDVFNLSAEAQQKVYAFEREQRHSRRVGPRKRSSDKTGTAEDGAPAPPAGGAPAEPAP